MCMRNNMELEVAIMFVGVATSFTHGYLPGRERPCTIPNGVEYRKSKFSLAIHSDRLAYGNVSEVFDGNWNFLPGAKVFHGLNIRVACTKDIYGDAIHKSYQTTCVDGQWNRKLPDCTAYRFCELLQVNISGAMPKVPVSPDQMLSHNYVMQYTCEKDYTINGSNLVVCTDGHWSEPEFDCVPDFCQTPKVPGATITSGKLENGRYPNNYILTYKCGAGWFTTGSGIFICEETQWKGKTNACERYIVSGLDVTNVTAEVLNDTDILVKWSLRRNESDVDDVQYFRILYTTESGQAPELWESVLIRNDTDRATLGDLIPKKVYTIAVVAGDGIGEGPMSNFAWVFSHGSGDYSDYYNDYYYGDYDSVPDPTPPTEPIPDRPVNVSASFHDNSILVSWNQPDLSSVRVMAYVVEYKSDGGHWQQTDLLFVPRSSGRLENLETGHTYNIRVISHGFDTESQPSEEVSITLPKGPNGCEALSIRDTVAPENAGEGSRLPHGTTLTYACESDRILVGNSTMVCNNGTWERSDFRCREYYSCSALSLPELTAPEETYNDSTMFRHGFVMTISCAPGEKLFGDPSVTCNDGIWSRADFECIYVGKSCPRVRIQRGRLNPQKRKYLHGSKVNIACRKRRGKYVDSGHHLHCNDGKWKGSKFVCRRRYFH